jgi:SAM-dependent methyltransferase
MALTDRGHPLLAPLLPLAPDGDLRALLLRLRSAAVAPPASNGELLALVEAACTALGSISQEAALLEAARPHSEERSALQVLVADKRLAGGELAGDETLAPTMLVPLLRRASRLACSDAELGERLLDGVGTLTASLSGHGEHTYRLGLGGGGGGGGSTGGGGGGGDGGGGVRAPLMVRHVPNSQHAGVRCGPAARLGIGACATGWSGLRLDGRAVLELGCGTGAVGLACAHLGASEVWCTDTDADALALAARNAAANGATAVRVARLDMLDEAQVQAQAHAEAEAARPDRSDAMPRHFGLVLAANLVYSGAAAALAALKAAARYVDMAEPQARVLCCFVQEQHSGGEQRSGIHTAQRGSVEDQELAALILPKYSSIEASRLMEAFEDGYEAACLGESVLECGLRLVASEHVPADMNAQSDALLMLLLAPATQQVKLSLNPGPDPDPDPDPDPYLTLTLTLTPTPTPTLTLALTLLLPLPST